MKDWFEALRVIAALLSLAVQCLAGTPHEKAVAAIAVAQAALDIADERPILPDTRPQNAVAPEPKDSADTGANTDGQGVPNDHENKFVIIDDKSVKQGSTHAPMRMTFDSTGGVSKRVATVYTGENKHGDGWCVNCGPLKTRWGDGNESIAIQWSRDVASGPQVYPAIRFRDEAGAERFPATSSGQYRLPDSLDELVKVVDRAGGECQNVQASGPAGAIHARTQIAAALARWRQYIGENVKASISWDRTGAQNFPLLARGDWSALALFGKSGRMELSAPGAAGLPVNSLGFGYRVTGDDISLDLDPVTLRGLALRLSPSSPGSQSTPTAPIPSQFDPLTIWTIFSVFRDIWSLLHPSCDLQLGGNVSATGVLTGDMLAIDFQQCPSVKLVALFTFQLSVKRVEITEQSVRVIFGGSRFVKERTFSVQ